MAALSDSDPCSYSKPDECSVTHIDLNLLVNFDAREVSGTAHLKVEKRQENAATLVRDKKHSTLNPSSSTYRYVHQS